MAKKREKDDQINSVVIRAAFVAINKLIDSGKTPEFVGRSKSLDPAWRDRWYGDCSALWRSFDFLETWKDKLEECPAAKEGAKAFTEDTLDGMLSTLGRVKNYLDLQLTRIIKALGDELR